MKLTELAGQAPGDRIRSGGCILSRSRCFRPARATGGRPANALARRLVRHAGYQAPAEVAETWLSTAPYVDHRIAEEARRSGLPASRADPATLLTESGRLARLDVTLARSSLTRNPSPPI
jgi:hypothetical protein